MSNDNIGIRLKELRKKRGLRQQHIADRFDVSRGTVLLRYSLICKKIEGFGIILLLSRKYDKIN